MIRRAALTLTGACFLAASPLPAQQAESAPAAVEAQQIAGLNHPQSRASQAPARRSDKELKVTKGPDLAAAKQTPEVQNPRSAQVEMSVTAALHTQKQAVDAEVMAQARLAIHPGVAQTPGPSQTMASHGGQKLGGDSSAGRMSSATAPKPANSSQNASSPSLSPNTSASGSLSMAGGGTVNPPVVGSTNSKFATLPQNYSGGVALTCATNPTMRILSVAGSPAPAVFTPITAYDLYTVSGCSFDNPGPDARAYIYKGGAFREDFQIQEWHDNWIKLTLDPRISGVLDQDEVTLVIQRADGTQASKSGFKFHAVRSVAPLQLIPSRWARLVTWTHENRSFNPEYSSPAMIEGEPGGPSAYVSRFTDGTKFDPNAQPLDQQFDSYDLSGLAAGWVGKSAQLQTFGTRCPLVVTYRQDFGTWRTEWDGTILRVYLADETCTSFNPAFPAQHWDNLTGSYYRLTVLAYGPRCTDPLTGKPDQQCIQRVQQGLQQQ